MSSREGTAPLATLYARDGGELAGAVRNARSGDTILLAGGDYSNINLLGVNFAGEVIIKSADADNPATLHDLIVRDSSGLTFRDLTFAADARDGLYGFTTHGSARITYDRIDVHGSLDGNPQNDTAAFMVRESRNVRVVNSEFHELEHGLSILNNRNVTIDNNSFHDIQTDGVRGGGNTDLAVRGNSFTDFYPAPGDHPDAIQLWTNGTPIVGRNILISDNVVTRGDGHPVQGIFLRDTFDERPFQNVTITDNVVVGAMGNGIAVDGVKGLMLARNQVVAGTDQSSTIRVEKAENAVVTDNSAAKYVYFDNDPGEVRRANNIVNRTVSPSDVHEVATWAAAQGGIPSLLAGLVSRFVDGFVDKLDLIDRNGDASAILPGLRLSETLVSGTDGDDTLVAAAVGRSRLLGGAGDDVLLGANNAKMLGGDGDDSYTVRGLNDIVIEHAGGGIDVVSSTINYTLPDNVEQLRLLAGGLTGHGNALDNRLSGSDGNDKLYGHAGDDMLTGGGGDDMLWGGSGDDILRGDAGNDTLYGEAGNDRLYGGGGDDVMYGGGGINTFEGGAGRDRLFGGGRADTFLYRTEDFAAGVAASMDDISGFYGRQGDRIGLTAVDANSATAVVDRFRFIGTAAFHGVAGELRYEVRGGDSYVMGDTDGDGKADLMIRVLGVGRMTADDFIL